MKKLLLLSLLGLSGCTHAVHLVNISDSRPYGKAGTPIQAQSEQFVIMFFAFDTKYVDQAYTKLQRQCAQGTITGISTKYYTDHGFFSWTNRLVMDGYCVAEN